MGDRFVAQTQLDRNLENDILMNIPAHYDKTETAINLYIRLCQIFSYNNEYYIFDGDKIVARKHERVSNMSKFNTVNNELICYELTNIYAKLLDLRGIEFNIKYKKNLNHFGGQHTNLTFFCEGFVVYADFVTSILDGDLFRGKMGLDLVGIICKNEEEFLQKSFHDKLSKVYSDLNDKSYLFYFKSLNERMMVNDLETKIMTFVSLSNMFFTSCMDKLSLLLFLKRTLLSDEEISACEMLIVKNNSKENKYINIYREQLAFPTMVIVISQVPYLYIPGNNLLKLSIDELKEMFDRGILEYKVDNPKRLSLF